MIVDEVRRILAGQSPTEVRPEDQALVEGYRQAMEFVLRRADDAAFQWTLELIVALHHALWPDGTTRGREGCGRTSPLSSSTESQGRCHVLLGGPPGSPVTRSEIARQPGEGRAPDLDRTQGNRGRREPRPTRRECSVGCLLRTRCNSRVLPLPYRCKLRNRCEGSCGGGARRPLEARGSTPWPPLPANRASVRTRGGSSCCGGLGPARYGPGSDRRRTKPSPDAYGGPRLGEGRNEMELDVFSVGARSSSKNGLRSQRDAGGMLIVVVVDATRVADQREKA